MLLAERVVCIFTRPPPPTPRAPTSGGTFYLLLLFDKTNNIFVAQTTCTWELTFLLFLSVDEQRKLVPSEVAGDNTTCRSPSCCNGKGSGSVPRMTTLKVSVALIRADGLLAADNGGTSDPFAVAELVYTDTGKPLKKARKVKTKTIKKTLQPEWNEAEVEWSGIMEAIPDLSLKVTVFDADMLSSEELGGVTIPLTSMPTAEASVEDSLISFPLKTVGKMKTDATGTITLGLRVLDGPANFAAAKEAARKELRETVEFLVESVEQYWEAKEAAEAEEQARLRAEREAAEEAFRLSHPDWKCEVCLRMNKWDSMSCRICYAERGRAPPGAPGPEVKETRPKFTPAPRVEGEDDYVYTIQWYDGREYKHFDLEDHMRNPPPGRFHRTARTDDGVRPRRPGTKVEFSKDEGETWGLIYTVKSSSRKEDLTLLPGDLKIGDIVYSKIRHSSGAMGSIMPRSMGTIKGPCTDQYIPDSERRVCVRFKSGLLINMHITQLSRNRL